MKVTQNPTPATTPSELGKTQGSERLNSAAKTPAETNAATSAARSASGASVEISDNARLMKRASEVAHSAPDVRKDRVTALKKSIADGTYHVDNDAIADRILEEHLGSSFGKNDL